MSVDLFFRLFSSFANAAIFALVIKSKIRAHPGLLIAAGGKNIETLLLLLNRSTQDWHTASHHEETKSTKKLGNRVGFFVSFVSSW